MVIAGTFSVFDCIAAICHRISVPVLSAPLAERVGDNQCKPAGAIRNLSPLHIGELDCDITRREPHRAQSMMNVETKSAFSLPPGIAAHGDLDSQLARRVHFEPPHAYRTPFARDAARILHARAFRRLAGKTQVFARLPSEPPRDHFRSRLTHTLEVTQISRTLATALGLEHRACRSPGAGPRHRPPAFRPCGREGAGPRAAGVTA